MTDLEQLPDEELMAIAQGDPLAGKSDEELAQIAGTRILSPGESALRRVAQTHAQQMYAGKFEPRNGKFMVDDFENRPEGTSPEDMARTNAVRKPDPNKPSINRFINNHVAMGDLKDRFAQDYPGESFPEGFYRKEVEKNYLGHAARSAQQYAQNTFDATDTDTMPGAQGAVRKADSYQQSIAKQRVEKDQAQWEDYQALARQELLAERQGKKGAARKIAEAAAGLPDMLALASLGPAGFAGAATVEGAIGRSARQGGSPFAPENLGPAAVMGTAQATILGTLGKYATGVADPLLRTGVRAGAGIAEQAGVDVAAGTADQALPERYQTGTRFGLPGHLARGEFGEAGADLASQAILFGAPALGHSLAEGRIVGGVEAATKAGFDPKDASLGKALKGDIGALSEVMSQAEQRGVKDPQTALGPVIRDALAAHINDRVRKGEKRAAVEKSLETLVLDAQAPADASGAQAGVQPRQGDSQQAGQAQQGASTTLPGEASQQGPGPTPADVPGVRDQANGGVVDTPGGKMPAELAQRLYPEQKTPGESRNANPPEVGPTPHDESGAPTEGKATAVPGSEEPVPGKPAEAPQAAPTTAPEQTGATLPAEPQKPVETPSDPEVINARSQARKSGFATPVIEESTRSGVQGADEAARDQTLQDVLPRLGEDADRYADLLSRQSNLTKRESAELDQLTSRAFGLEDPNTKQGSLRDQAKALGVSHETVRKRLLAEGKDTSGKLNPDEQAERDARSEVLRAKAVNTVADLYKDDTGAFNVGQTVQNAALGLEEIGNQVRELAGQHFPRTHKIDREVGEAATRLAASRDWGRAAAPVFTDKVMPDATPQERHFVTSLSVELQLRHTRAFRIQEANAAEAKMNAELAKKAATSDPVKQAEFQKSADAWAKEAAEKRQAAQDVRSFVGTQGFPAASEPEFQQMIGSKPFLDFVDRYQKSVGDLITDFARKTENLPPGSPLPPSAQIPGFPMNLLRGDPNAPNQWEITQPGGNQNGRERGYSGGGQGNLRNLRQSRLRFMRERTGAGDAYVTDLNEILANTFENSAYDAAKAELNHLMVNKGYAVLADSANRPPDIQGFDVVEFPFTKGGMKDKNLYVAEPFAPEYRRALNTDKATTLGPITPALNGATKVQMASLADASTHSLGLLRALFMPKAMGGVAKSIYDRIYNTQGWREQLLDVVRINAAAAPTFESAGSSLKPLNWLGNSIKGMDNLVRVGMDNAFDTIAKKYNIPVTEQNRRDFISQAVINYNKSTQNQIVRLLRETGVGPFASAASANAAGALRLLIGSHGLKTGGWKTDVALRAQVLGKVAALVAAAPALNYLVWGSVFGDDDVPLGAVKLGEYDGKTVSIDLPGTQIVRRGLRATGLLALMEGVRSEEEPSMIASKAFKGMYQSALHPAEGPAVSLVHTAITGENMLGKRIADRPEKGEGDLGERLLAAAYASNPAASALLGGDESPGREPRTIGSRLEDLAGDKKWERILKLFGSWAPRVSEQK